MGFDGIDTIAGCFSPPCGPPRVPTLPDAITIRPPLGSSYQSSEITRLAPDQSTERHRDQSTELFIGYTITVTASPDSGGTVIGVNSNYPTITVTATPNSGFIFVNWTDENGFASSSASYTFTATRNRALTANFTASGSPTPHPHVTPTPHPPHVTPTPRPPHVTPTPHPPHVTPTPRQPNGGISYSSVSDPHVFPVADFNRVTNFSVQSARIDVGSRSCASF